MDIKYLNYVLIIAQEKNLRRAAEKLYISQPSLSQYLTKLEAELGTPLFMRTSKELVLTDAGKLYVETIQTIVDLRNKMYRDITNLTYKNHLSIATTSQWGIHLVSQVIPEFTRKYPGIMLELTESFFPSMSKILKNGEVDICLASVITPNLNYNVNVLGEEEIMLMTSSSHDFCQTHNPSVPVSMEALVELSDHERLLLTSKGSTTQTLVEAMFQKLNYYPRITGYFDNINTVCKMVAGGMGISFIPKTCISATEAITCYSLEHRLCRQHIIAYRKDPELDFTIGELIKMIQECYNKTWV